MDGSLVLQSGFWILGIGSVLVFPCQRLLRKHHILATGLLGALGLIFVLLAVVSTLLTQQTLMLQLPISFPTWTGIGPFSLRLDSLSAFFALLICSLGIPVSLYLIGYLKEESHKYKHTGFLCGLYLLFLLSMLCVVLSGNLVQFLICWELMTLASFGFVIAETDNMQTRHAGWLYLLMTHIGTACLLIAFIVMADKGGGYDISLLSGLGQHLSPDIKTVLLVLLLIGFGTKAGMVPLHIWLPEAHPAAPSHVSALMSGAMIKTGLYGLLLFMVKILAPISFGWGIAIATIGIVTALLGIVSAASEQDYKRALAYSSVENMGIILLALGVGLAYESLGQPVIAALAIFAALFHALNHAVFKGLLFLGAGSVLSATHTRNLDLLGGLVKTMPHTTFFFLIGALAICAFPPFNGFASEWLIFQILLSGENLVSTSLKIFNPLAATLLGLVGALAAATFVKMFSTIFLALPRSRHAEHAKEVSPSMQLGMAVLSLLCIVLGLFPAIASNLLVPMVTELLGQPEMALSHLADPKTLGFQPFDTMSASLIPLEILLLLIATWLLAKILPRLLGGQTGSRREDTWSCGVDPLSTFEHTASGFGQPINQVFAPLRQVDGLYHDWVYVPIVRGLMKVSPRFQPIQAGQVHLYLVYILLTLVGCLVWISL